MKLRSVAILICAITLAGCDGPPIVTVAASESIIDALGHDVDPSFTRVTGPVELEFPRDHGAHPRHQMEWWYFTGNLADEDDNPFGFQLTFFRTGLTGEPSVRSSAWAASHTWMAHLAVTDGVGRRFASRERFAREALGLSGATSSPFRVWTASWSASAGGDGLFPLSLKARDGDAVAIDLVLEEGKPMVLQGDRGYSRKGKHPGNASHYVSYTRTSATGTVSIGGRTVSVSGTAWMDHEWSTSALDEGLVGWDWFAIQLADGRDIMVYALRDANGSAGPFSAATIIAPGGKTTVVPRDGFEIDIVSRWTSERTDVRYPSRWRIRIPEHGIDLDVRPLIPDQELRLSVVYWEGAVTASRADGTRVGRGYAELVGYAESSRR